MKNVVITVLVVAIVVIAGWFVYRQGFADNEQDIQINLPGGSPQGGY